MSMKCQLNRKGKSLRMLEMKVSRRSTCCTVLEDGWYVSWRGGEYDGEATEGEEAPVGV